MKKSWGLIVPPTVSYEINYACHAHFNWLNFCAKFESHNKENDLQIIFKLSFPASMAWCKDVSLSPTHWSYLSLKQSHNKRICFHFQWLGGRWIWLLGWWCIILELWAAIMKLTTIPSCPNRLSCSRNWSKWKAYVMLAPYGNSLGLKGNDTIYIYYSWRILSA